MFEKADNILNRHANRYGLKKSLDAAMICFKAKEVANSMFEPISFRNGILKVKVENSIKAQEIQLNSSQIIKKINQKVGFYVIKKIIFQIN